MKARTICFILLFFYLIIPITPSMSQDLTTSLESISHKMIKSYEKQVLIPIKCNINEQLTLEEVKKATLHQGPKDEHTGTPIPFTYQGHTYILDSYIFLSSNPDDWMKDLSEFLLEKKISLSEVHQTQCDLRTIPSKSEWCPASSLGTGVWYSAYDDQLELPSILEYYIAIKLLLMGEVKK